MSDRSSNLSISYLQPSQAQKHVTVNEALRRLDALVQPVAVSATLAAQPTSPADGAVYILPAGKTGAAWGAMANGTLAYWCDGVWEALTPKLGWVVRVADLDCDLRWSGTAWGMASPTSPGLCEGRLSAVSGAAMGEGTAITSIFFSPFRGNQIALKGPFGWRGVAFAEKTLKLTDTQTGMLASGSPIVTGLSDAKALSPGMLATGAGVPGGAVVASVDSATQITLSANATVSGANALTFKAPANTNFDVFAVGTDATFRLVLSAWANDTERASALALVDGVSVRSSDTARYLGTVRTTGVDGQTEFTPNPAAAAGGNHPKLFIWNAQNRLTVAATCRDSTDSWTYTVSTLRAMNNSTGNRVSFVTGLAGDAFDANHLMRADSTNDDVFRLVGIGYDSTSALAAGSITGQSEGKAGRPGPQLVARFAGAAEPGFHFVQALEWSVAAGTTTWFGDGGAPTLFQTGMIVQMQM
jgi:hypothetical protein